MHTAQRLAGLSLVIIAAVISDNAVPKNPDPQNKIAKRKIEQTERYRRELDREWLRTHAIDGSRGESVIPGPNFSAIRDYPTPRESFLSASGRVPPPPSPGQDIGYTSFDLQSVNSQGYYVARTPAGAKIHFTWMSYKYIPASPTEYGRYVIYSSYTDMNLYPNMTPSTPYNGIELTGPLNYGGFSGIDVDATNHAHVAYHRAENDYGTGAFKPWHSMFPFGSNLFQTFKLSGYDNSCPEQTAGMGGVLWPRITADRGSAFVHEIAHSNVNDCPQDKLWYWRFNGTAWSGPAIVSNTPTISYVLGADAGSDKVAIVTHDVENGSQDVGYVESTTNGTDWLALVPNVDPVPTPTIIADYGNPPFTTENAWNHLTATYDNSGYLHVMWDEQENDNTHAAIKHWSQNPAAPRIRTVTQGYWDNPVSNGIGNLNFAKISMGIGDGSTLCSGQSNDDYVYATFVQFGGSTTTELSDHSSEYSYQGRFGGYMNGEVYLVVSNTNGNTWSPKVNLTDTKTPGCNPGLADLGSGEPANPDSVCRSENWATIGRVVKDVDIFFISDLDAGAIPYGEGSWQLNPVHYLQLSGPALVTNGGVCPVIAPVFGATLTSPPQCEYNAPRFGVEEATLTILNIGSETVFGDVTFTDFQGDPELSVSQSGPYSITSGAPDLALAVTMSSNGASEGIYSGAIAVTHNDTTQRSPRQFPITFYVFDSWNCPGCACPCLHDPNCDGLIVTVVDVVTTVDVAFRNNEPTTDLNCPRTRTDVDADGVTGVLDVVKVINVAFRNQTVAEHFVDPCL